MTDARRTADWNIKVEDSLVDPDEYTIFIADEGVSHNEPGPLSRIVGRIIDTVASQLAHKNAGPEIRHRRKESDDNTNKTHNRLTGLLASAITNYSEKIGPL